VRVIEIVAPVIDTLRRYLDGKGRSGVDSLLTNPKFEVVIADGRHALALDAMRYDVIEADAILPKTALSGLLNSQEFFRQVKAKLAPGGIYVQWAPTERSIETFRSIFPYVAMMHPALLGSDRPIPISREKILELLARPEIDIHLTSARIDRAELLKWFEDKKIEVLNDGRTVPATSPNTDFFPRDEYYLNRP
jgi:spermidine synthase